jgi:hypothetical protein
MEDEEKPDWIRELEYRQHGILPLDEEARRSLTRLREREPENYDELRNRDRAAWIGSVIVAVGLCLMAAGAWLGWFALSRSDERLWLCSAGVLIYLGWKVIKRALRD